MPDRGQGTSYPKVLSPTKAAGQADSGPSLNELQDLGPPSLAQDSPAVAHVRDTELIAPIPHEPERVVSSTTPILSGHGGFVATAASLPVARIPTTPQDTTPVLAHSTDTDGPAAFPPEQGQQGGIRSTPEAQIGLPAQASPQTEELPRGNGFTLPLRLESPSPRPALEDCTFEEFLGEMIGVIAAMSMCREQAPPGAYSVILSSLPAGGLLTTKDAEVAPPGSIWTTDAKDWSGQMWIRFLEAGEGRSQKTTVLNMIGYMGASVWYDTKLAEFQAPLTKRGKPRKRKATPFLDSLVTAGVHGTSTPSDLSLAEDQIRKRRKLAPEGVEDTLTAVSSPTISQDVLRRRRSQIIEKVKKGRKLRNMVSMAGRGVLLRSNIW